MRLCPRDHLLFQFCFVNDDLFAGRSFLFLHFFCGFCFGSFLCRCCFGRFRSRLNLALLRQHGDGTRQNDHTNHNGELTEKKGIEAVAPGDTLALALEIISL